MSEIKSVIISPAPDTVFTLLNCSRDSSVLNHYRSLCFNFSGHSCDKLYGSCTSFRLFHLLSSNTPPCCFTGYDTVKYMSMNILDCTHYTTVYNTDGLHGVASLDWIYGIKLSYSVPDIGCDRYNFHIHVTPNPISCPDELQTPNRYRQRLTLYR
ncbi:hypothetical protein RJ639_013394 [Escallonia herrerae]|uniref:Uncharacterized protein n=1 Tax=Escallonia herrerae TaxID=1293975 RepID=A0AA89ALH4_9ASTE|nr:hypothetical protein RJ639_013394 [Escallonia herrerae]